LIQYQIKRIDAIQYSTIKDVPAIPALMYSVMCMQ